MRPSPSIAASINGARLSLGRSATLAMRSGSAPPSSSSRATSRWPCSTAAISAVTLAAGE
jgi:hypothetical protein